MWMVFKIPKYSHKTLCFVFKIQRSDWLLKFLNIVIKHCDWLSLHGDVRLIVGFTISFIQFFRDLNKTYINSWRKQLMSNTISNKFAFPKLVIVLEVNYFMDSLCLVFKQSLWIRSQWKNTLFAIYSEAPIGDLKLILTSFLFFCGIMRVSRQFQACLFFFYEKVLSVKKNTHKQKSTSVQKLESPLFCVLVLFYTQNLFVKKINKQARNCPDKLIILYYSA